MGKLLSKLADYCPEPVARSVSNSYNRRIRDTNKRKADSLDDEAELYEALHSPKKRKLLCTTHYIYKALYVEGKDSDITVEILNKNWKLHKVYLRQSQYFNSMFSGVWDESNKSNIRIEVEDPNITIEALNTVFSSFYLDEITVEPCNVIGVLAASTMFQLEGLIEQCCEIMIETLSPITAVKYYHGACSYGSQKVKEKTMEWFLMNLTDYFVKNASRLQDIDIDLMSSIVSHPDLFVIPSELALYNLLKKWVYCRLHPDKDSNAASMTDVENYFRTFESNVAFLLTDTGLEYMRIFRQLRLVNMILHMQDYNKLVKDRIIPESWLLTAFKKQWVTLLDICSGNDKGPDSLNEKYFAENCLRCGTVISVSDTGSWRWNWFTFGIDIVWCIADNKLILTRQRNSIESSGRPTNHSIILQVDLINFDKNRQIKKCQRVEPMRVILARNQDIKIANLDSDFVYPLYIIIKLQLSSNSSTNVNQNEN
ncbi:hypothetical protein O3M35_008655 [Rhynocoris fuscipes]|uniref:BTB domain-containing protein n=1 Tax=Rhynocoris fuscipes TaxID=488301 RepID=A0AAW1D8A9_9HEMI